MVQRISVEFKHKKKTSNHQRATSSFGQIFYQLQYKPLWIDNPVFKETAMLETTVLPSVMNALYALLQDELNLSYRWYMDKHRESDFIGLAAVITDKKLNRQLHVINMMRMPGPHSAISHKSGNRANGKPVWFRQIQDKRFTKSNFKSSVFFHLVLISFKRLYVTRGAVLYGFFLKFHMKTMVCKFFDNFMSFQKSNSSLT